MVIKDRNSTISHNNILFVLTLYTLTIFIYRDFNVPEILGYVGLICIVFFAVLLSKWQISFDKYFVALALLLVVICLEIIIGYLKNGNNAFLMYIPALLLLSICALIARPNENEIVKTIKVWWTLSVVFSVYVIMISLFPALYYSVVRFFLSDYAKTMNDAFISKGYGVALGGNIVFIEYVVVFAFLLLVNTLIFKRIGDYKTNYFKVVMIIAVIGLSVFMVNRKSELLSLMVAVAFLLIFNANYDRKSRKRKIMIIMTSLFLAMITLGIILYNANALGRYGDFIEILIGNLFSGDNKDYTSGRFNLWGIAFDLFKDYPINGIGWGGFAEHVPYYAQSSDVEGYGVRNVHNCYLQFLCETGIIGFTIIVSLIIVLFGWSVYRSNCLKKDGAEQSVRIVHSTCVGYQFFFLVVSFIDPSMYKIIFWFFYVISFIISGWMWKLSKRSCKIDAAFISRFKFIFR